jgi:predicted dinucleotide-binding enzyme
VAFQKIGVLGSGVVSQVLADGFLKHGYEVMRGTREVEKLADWKKKAGPKASVGAFSDTARFGEAVVLAVKGTAAESALKLSGPDHLAGKIVIDATNPIADQPPTKGVLKFFTTLDESLLERLQKLSPRGRFVKAFSCTGNANFVNPDFGGVKPTMFICGNDEAAKGQVKEILTQFGWEIEDMGSAEAARAIEPLCMLWCIPGLLRNQWSHAFKLLRK